MGARMRLKLVGSGGPGPDLTPPSLPLEPCSPAELRALVLGGENDSDACEGVLAQAARSQAAIDVAMGEGLRALLLGDRLLALGFSSLRDYAREVLDLGERSAQALVQLARALPARPLLARALRAGEVRIRAAQTILPVARGEAEARWVERARHETVRALEVAVREERAAGEAEGEGEGDDTWTRFRVRLSPEDRAVVDEALAVAGKILPGSSREERLEVMAQEYVGEHPVEAGEDVPGSAFRPDGDPARRARLEQQLEEETERWSYLSRPQDVPAPETGLDPFSTEVEIDARLRELAALRRGWDEVVGVCAHLVRRSGLWRIAGYASFEHYAKERLGLSARTVEQRAALERRLWQVPALRAARDAGLSYERLRLLARLTDREIAAWVPRAATLTVVELRWALAEHQDTQMRAARVLRARVPERVASLLRAAFRAVRVVEGRLLDDGSCLVRVARHFLATWKPHVKRARTVSQKVRERDLGRCRVPGCSRRADDGHHIILSSRGGSDDPTNRISLCRCHHLRGVHGGYIRVRGCAPDGLVWEVGPRHAPVDLRSRCLSGLRGAGPAAQAA